MELGNLEKVEDLRTIWKNEASDFTNWLAEDKNIKLLSNELGLDISVDDTEASNGRYYADILAHDENTEQTIIIENQLEMTNHDHLGKIIVYSSGLDAKIQIWIVKEVHEEHKQAVEWLNEHSDNSINIFLMKVELWKIDDSKVAPKFQVISRPNNGEFNRTMSTTNLVHLKFWESFREYCDGEADFSLRKPLAQHWYIVPIGHRSCYVSLTYNIKKRKVACELYIPNDKDLYYSLEQHKDKINAEISQELQWMPLEDKKASRIKFVSDLEVSPDEDDWKEAFGWLKDMSEKFIQVFPKYWSQ